MRHLRIPNNGELLSWTFKPRKGTIWLWFHRRNAAKQCKSLGITLPLGSNIHYHLSTDQWYIEGIDKEESFALTKILQDLSSRLQVGMKRDEWERALPELYRRVVNMTVSKAIERYHSIRLTGNDYHHKGTVSIIKAIRFAKKCWDRMGVDMDIFRLKHSAHIDQDAKKELDGLIRKFITYMKSNDCSPATQKLYLFYVKSAINAMAQEFDLFIPESVDRITVNVSAPEVLVIQDDQALKALAELSILNKKDSQREAIICAKIMYAFGLRISDATGLTVHNFRQGDEGVLLRVVSHKTKTFVNHLVPESLWRDIHFCLKRWEGKLVYLSAEDNTGRIRRKMHKIVELMPGMNEQIQVVKQMPNGDKVAVWTTLAKEFKPHMLRRTSGTINHNVTGHGNMHLGNSEQIFNKHYLSQSKIDYAEQRRFHVALGLVEDGGED